MNRESIEHISSTVAPNERQSFWAIVAIFIGFIIVVGNMAIGGGMAAQQTQSDFFASVLIGNIILAALAAVAGWIGAESGKTFNMLLEDAFPGPSWRLVSLYVPIVLIGWFGVEAALFGKMIGYAFGLPTGLQRVVMSASTLVFATSCYLGFRSIKLVSYIAVPLIFAIGLFALYKASLSTTKQYGFLNSTMSLSAGTAAVVGSWIMGVLTCLPDITRFARTPLQGALAGSIGIFLGHCFNILVGGAGAALAGESDPAKILLAFGFLPLAILLSLGNIWTTNDSNMYSASLNLARGLNITRRTAVVIGTVIAAVFSAFDPTSIKMLFGFLIFMGNTAPALGGVVLAGYIYNRKRNMYRKSVVAAWLGWITGSAISIAAGGLAGIFSGLIVGAVLWLTIVTLSSARGATPTAQS